MLRFVGDGGRIFDESFHHIIIEAAGNERIAETLNNLKEQLFRFRFEYLKDVKEYSHLVEDHKMLINAIEAGKSDLAVEIIKLHIDQQTMAIYGKLSRLP